MQGCLEWPTDHIAELVSFNITHEGSVFISRYDREPLHVCTRQELLYVESSISQSRTEK